MSETTRAKASRRFTACASMQKLAKGGEELLMRSGLTVGNIYMMKAFT